MVPFSAGRARRGGQGLRRLWEACLLILALLVSAPPFARDAAATATEAGDLLLRIEDYLNSVRTLQADFVQIASTGEIAGGVVYLSRPGRMRIEYRPPSPILIVADGTFLIYYDRSLEQVSYIPLGSTPADILLAERIDLTGDDITVTALEREAGMVRVSLVRTENPAEGSLMLVFNSDPLRLERWAVTDAQGITTTVALEQISFNVDLQRSLFEFRDPRIFKDRLN